MLSGESAGPGIWSDAVTAAASSASRLQPQPPAGPRGLQVTPITLQAGFTFLAFCSLRRWIAQGIQCCFWLKGLKVVKTQSYKLGKRVNNGRSLPLLWRVIVASDGLSSGSGNSKATVFIHFQLNTHCGHFSLQGVLTVGFFLLNARPSYEEPLFVRWIMICSFGWFCGIPVTDDNVCSKGATVSKVSLPAVEGGLA